MMQVSGEFDQGFTGIWFMLPGYDNNTRLGAQVHDPHGLLFSLCQWTSQRFSSAFFYLYSKSTFNV